MPNPVSLGTGAKAPMVSLKVKKQKKRSRREVVESRGFRPTQSWRHPGLSRRRGRIPRAVEIDCFLETPSQSR